MSSQSLTLEDGIAHAIREHLGDKIENVRVFRKSRMSLVASKDTVKEVAEWLRSFGFDHTIAVSGVDRFSENRIDVVYFLSSFSRDELKHLIISLEVHLARENPSICSLTSVWESANLFEREAYEMFGINFDGHPNLEKLLLQDNWDGPPPLRKDLKIPELA